MFVTRECAVFAESSHASRRVSRTMEGGEKPTLDSPINDLLCDTQIDVSLDKLTPINYTSLVFTTISSIKTVV